MIEPKYLQDHALFGGLEAQDLAAIIPLLSKQVFMPGDYIVHEGDEGRFMYFIRRGSVEVVKNAVEGEIRLATLGEGDTFGEMELVDVQPRSASVKALEPATVYALSNDDMHEIYEHNQQAFIIILMNIAREISRRLRKMDALVASSLYGNAISLNERSR